MNSLTKSKILVIGGAGFIGSHVVAELLKTDASSIVVYDNFTRENSPISHLIWLTPVARFIPTVGTFAM